MTIAFPVIRIKVDAGSLETLVRVLFDWDESTGSSSWTLSALIMLSVAGYTAGSFCIKSRFGLLSLDCKGTGTCSTRVRRMLTFYRTVLGLSCHDRLGWTIIGVSAVIFATMTILSRIPATALILLLSL